MLVLFLIILFVSCSQQMNSIRTTKEMQSVAEKQYKDYLFDYGLDSTRFTMASPNVIAGGKTLYRWAAVTAAGDTVGIEVEVFASKKEKPMLSITGQKEAWYAFLEENRIAKQVREKKK